MARRTFTVLFLSNRNSARSILAEAYVNSLKLPQLKACSAGPAPFGDVDPMAIAVLEDSKIPTRDIRSKSWDEFARRKVDIVVSLCAKEPSPSARWPVRPISAHWTVPNPAAVEGSDGDRRSAYVDTLLYVKQRIDYLRQFDEAQLENISKRASRGLPKESRLRNAEANRALEPQIAA